MLLTSNHSSSDCFLSLHLSYISFLNFWWSPLPFLLVWNLGKAERGGIFGGTCSFEKAKRCIRIFKRTFCRNKQRGCGESYLYGSLVYTTPWLSILHCSKFEMVFHFVWWADKKWVFLTFELSGFLLWSVSPFLFFNPHIWSYFRMHEGISFSSSIHVTDAKYS